MCVTEKSEVKVSVIMPVYNSEKYLRKAIDSVLNQDLSNFELILVDDGSSDNSPNICDDYSRTYPHVITIHKKNGGICSARNEGMRIARGEYITFCDNDDEFLAGLLSENYYLGSENDADLVRYIHIRRHIRADGKYWDTKVSFSEGLITSEKFGESYIDLTMIGGVWAGLYKKKIIDQFGLTFDENYRYGQEDEKFNLMFLQHCNRVWLNPKAYYIWLQRETHSTSKKFHPELADCIIHNTDYESILFRTVCHDVNSYDKVHHLTNAYVYKLTEYLTEKTANIPQKEKVRFLSRLRNKECFADFYDKSTRKLLFKKDKKTFLIAELFRQRRYKELLLVVQIGSRILGKIRYH